MSHVDGGARVLVTGSSDGIGARMADKLVGLGHHVIVHARNVARAERCPRPAGSDLVIGDLSSMASTRRLADSVRALGDVHVVIHNAGWQPKPGEPPEGRPVTADGLEATFQINVLAPYLLTALLPLPERIVYVSSDSITRASVHLADLQHRHGWTPDGAYADSKLALTALALGVARRYPSVVSNAVHPGWVRTKMAGDEAPRSLDEGADTPVWLAVSDDPAARTSGQFFHDRRVRVLNEQAYEPRVQDGVIAACARLTGVDLP